MKIEFRLVTEEDRHDIFEYGSDLQTVQFLPWGPLTKLEDVNIALIQSHESQAAIYDGKMIGTFSIVAKMPDALEIGYVLNSCYWQKGIGTKGLTHLLDYIKKHYPKKKIIKAKTKIENYASQGLLKKFNFQLISTDENFNYYQLLLK